MRFEEKINFFPWDLSYSDFFLYSPQRFCYVVRSESLAGNFYSSTQMSDSSWEFLKIENEQITIAQNNCYEKNFIYE